MRKHVALVIGLAALGTGAANDFHSVTFGGSSGSVELAARGLVKLVPDIGPPVMALEVRVTITNVAESPTWTLDAADTRLVVPGETPRAPIAVRANVPTVPLAIASPGQYIDLDLYFAEPRAPASFDVEAPVVAAGHTLDARAHFAAPGRAELGSEMIVEGGDHWWFDPKNAWSVYAHSDGVVMPEPPHSAIVRSADSRDTATR